MPVESLESATEPGTPSTPLRRHLALRHTAALTFAGVGATAGLFGLFGFSLSSAGPAFVWGWLLVGIAVLFLCLMWAELASHYPRAGAFYYWPAAFHGPRVGWWVGWMYLFAQIAVVTGWYFTLPLAVEPLFHLPVTTGWSVGIALAALVVAALVNAAGIDILGKLTVLGVAAEVFILVVLSTLVLIFGSHQSPSILLNGSPFTQFSGWLPAFLGGGIFVSLWVLYAFENAGLLGEETKDAPRIAPRAVLLALLGTFLMGVYFLFAFVISIPNVQAIEGSATPVQDIISHALPGVFVVIYLALIAGVTLLGANAYFTAVSRQVYGMARSGLLPFSTFLARTRNGTPYAAILIVAAVSALPFIASQDYAILVTGATGAMYVSYFALVTLLLVARLRGWPKKRGAFSLGRLGIPLNVAAVVASGLIVLNLLWPRDATNPVWHLNIRVAYWLVGIPLALGIVYYGLVIRRRLPQVASSDPANPIPEVELTLGRSK